MTLFIVHSNYFPDGNFGVYSSIRRARKAILTYLAEADDVVAIEDTGNYAYTFTTNKGEQFFMEIIGETLDYEFVEGLIEE